MKTYENKPKPLEGILDPVQSRKKIKKLFLSKFLFQYVTYTRNNNIKII